jgi:hypothetical protein
LLAIIQGLPPGVDEGNGRYTPCSALVKQKKAAAKQ